jgi:hypothetical protein
MAEAQAWVKEHKDDKDLIMPEQSIGELYIKIGADISEFTAKIDLAQTKIDRLVADCDSLNVKLEAISQKQQAPAIEPKPIEPPPAPIPAKHSFTAAEVQEFLNSPDMKVAVNEAIKVGLAKIRGKVI